MALCNKHPGVLFHTLLIGVACMAPAASAAQPTWKRVYGGQDSEEAVRLLVRPDEHILVLGVTSSFGSGASDLYLFELQPDGTRLWSTTFGGPGVDSPRSMVLMDDGGVVMVGARSDQTTAGYDGLVIRADASGAQVWARTQGGGDWDFLHDVDRTVDGGLIAVGVTYSQAPEGNAWILRMDEQGQELWETRLLPGTSTQAHSVHALPDGSFLVAGSKKMPDGFDDAWVARLDALGAIEWEYTYGGDSTDVARNIIPTQDGGASIVGTTHSFATVKEHYHFKVDANGGLLWERNWGQVADQEAMQHIELQNMQFASIGYVSQGGAGGKDMFLLRSYDDGNFLLGQTQGGDQDDIGASIGRISGGFVICGTTYSYGAGLNDIMVIRTDEVGFTASNDVIVVFDPLSMEDGGPPVAPSIRIHPNPNHGVFTLSADRMPRGTTVRDAWGREVAHRWDALSYTIQLADPVPGSYVLEAVTSSGQHVMMRFLVVAD